MSSLLKTVTISAVRILGLLSLVTASVVLMSCSSGTKEPSGAAGAADCPTDPVDVVVSVDQWGDIVSELGGACTRVTTLLAGSAADPHDYEPTPADAAAFRDAQLVVVNGGHYDEWAAKLAAASAPTAPVVTAAPEDTPNPHVWYDPVAVVALADTVTAKLSALAPGAAAYFTDRRAGFTTALQPYDAAVAALKAGAAGKSYAATEAVFDDMAAAIGLQNRTPAGYQASAAHEAEPSPGDLGAFLKLLAGRGVDVLIYNTQTEGALPQQIRAAAEAAGVPVVEVTETVAPGAKTFEAWQVDQLTALAKALGVSR